MFIIFIFCNLLYLHHLHEAMHMQSLQVFHYYYFGDIHFFYIALASIAVGSIHKFFKLRAVLYIG